MSNNGSKSKEYLFVDGYNIINSWEKLRSLSEIDLEVARNELIDIMVEYQYYTKIKVIVVFDAHMVKGSSGRKEIIKDIEVVYTKEDETADQYIEKTLDDIGRVKKVRVATSDWMEQQVVLGRGGTRISARELEVEIENQKKLINKKNKRKNQINDLIIGRLDEKIIKKLENWRKEQE
ncbi:NYN domain-containing protein [Anaerosalibacter bizertensis]|uniref:NYN domain-containing protein n=1 Tax=Anaerosalibacter bizertensis TaxID=932217 RepID=A0A844FEI5_9FIRM|nr:NYN domain-containing protein [Anaerosalibacter bizertensis]MSS42395.1 NYN domain-containing protein [Anaerosalibacter bizertensis]HHV25898.1 NYN domain-containing protein [Tissierellia bacterium]